LYLQHYVSDRASVQKVLTVYLQHYVSDRASVQKVFTEGYIYTGACLTG